MSSVSFPDSVYCCPTLSKKQMENIESMPEELPEQSTTSQLYGLKVKIALVIMVVLSLTVSRYGFWFLGEEPRYIRMNWYMVVAGAIAFMLFPMLYLGIAYLAALLQKKPAPRVLGWMIAIWAIFMFFAHAGQRPI